MHERCVAVFAGGGTGGHLYPALALADELVRQRPDVRPFFVGARAGLEARVLPERGVDHRLLPIRGVQRGELLSNVGVPFALVRSLAGVVGLFRRLDPELVVVTGGYAGAPAGLAAVIRRTPLVLQEQNAWPGVTTRFLSRWAAQVHLAFPEATAHLPASGQRNSIVSGCPVRPLPDAWPDRDEVCRRLGLDPGRSVLLIVGGSQGSAALNEMVLETIRGVECGAQPLVDGWQLLWATGPRHHEAVVGALAELGDPSWVRAIAYIEDMPSALAVVDLAVSRAGAMTTAELLAWGVPALLVPLPTAAANHQELNAQALEDAGAALHLSQSGLTPEGLWSAVAELAQDADRLGAMARAARARSRPEATAAIVSDIVRLLPAPRREGAA